MKLFKKIEIALEGLGDRANSHYPRGYVPIIPILTTLFLTPAAVLIGFIFEGGQANQEELEINNFTPQNGAVELIVNESCKLAAERVLIAKTDEEGYTLYFNESATNNKFIAQDQASSSAFAYAYEKCAAQGYGGQLYLGENQFSQAYRLDRRDDKKPDLNFRIGKPSHKGDLIDVWDIEQGISKTGNYEYGILKHASNDFKQGRIFDHINAVNIQGYEEVDAFKYYPWHVFMISLVGFGFLGFAYEVAGEPKDPEYKKRQKERQNRKDALDMKDFDF